MARLGLTLIALGLLVGCTTKRYLEIASQPSGAHIWVNGIHLKERTPVEIPFTHYGRWDVRLEKKGYDSLATEVEIDAGIDGYPIVDLFLETVIPEKRFRRSFDLRPLGSGPTEADVAAARKRADAFRTQAYEEAEKADAPERLLPGTDDLVP